MEQTSQFTREIGVFERYRREWSRSHPGEFVVIQGDEIVDGFFETYADALRAGLQKFGARRGFLVKQVWVTEPVYLV
jgi:hypothetical protein